MNILITGGATGLGASIVRELSSAGHSVYFTWATSAKAAAELEQAVQGAKALHCDFSDDTSVAAILKLIPTLEPDILVNNACGPIHKEHFHKMSGEMLLQSYRQNVLQTVRITQEAMRCFRKKKFGKIINIISSAVINKPPLGYAEYAANKSYLLSMSKSWATEGIRFNITSNCISPGFMETGMTADTDARIVEQMIASHPLKKLLTTQEVARVVAFYCQATQHINGTNLVMNAGEDIA